jgi:hypothetical protein
MGTILRTKTRALLPMPPRRRHPALAKGTRAFPHSHVSFDLGSKSSFAAEDDDSSGTESRFTHHNSRPPKSDFPKFDGENPRWWKKVCEKYFDMNTVDHDTWATFSTMLFIGNADLWLQTYEVEHDVASWEELCFAVHSKFGRDRHHRDLEALECCRQTDTVENYYHKFEVIRHKVLVRKKYYDEAVFVTKFVSGLKK